MVSKRLLKTGIIAILICQILALLIWVLFDENYFIHLIFAPIIGLAFGYKGIKKEE